MSRRALEQDHTPRAVSKRLAMEPSPSYLHDVIYGAIDPRGANLIADGLCMAAKGFEGDELERVVEVITSDDDAWVDTMMREELGYASNVGDEYRAALAALVAFLTIGFLPLMALLAVGV